MNLNKRICSFFAVALLISQCFFSCGEGGAESYAEAGEGVLRFFAKPSEGVGRNFVAEEVVEPMPQVICIDPGHGFDDGGTSSEYLNGLNEDDITLAISQMLAEELQALGYQTILTHDGNSFPITSAYDNNNKFRPEERTAFANSIDIDYYVSIHCNSYDDPSVYGTKIYYYDSEIKTEHTSDAIAESIQNGLLQSLDSGSRCSAEEMTSGAYYVIRRTVVPASLIETGFVTNESDAAKLIDPEWQRSFAKGVAAGIDAFYRAEQQ